MAFLRRRLIGLLGFQVLNTAPVVCSLAQMPSAERHEGRPGSASPMRTSKETTVPMTACAVTETGPPAGPVSGATLGGRGSSPAGRLPTLPTT